MKTSRYVLSQLFFALFLSLFFSYPARAETTNCTAITSLPYTITTQGIYCLTGHLSTGITAGNAITINTNNVVLDLNGYKIGGLAAGPGTNANGIYAEQRQNIIIKNGTVRGFYAGINLYDASPLTTSQGHIIEDIRADMNTHTGIGVSGRGNIIRNNQVVDTGGAPGGGNVNAYGIHIVGPGNRVINNDVYETKEQGIGGKANGIYAVFTTGVVIGNNRVGNAEFGPGTSYGVHLYQSDNALVKDNTISVMDDGIYYNATGIGSSGIYMNNLTSGCTNPFTGGTAAGTTNYHQP
jgi:hypothetical protein